MTNKSGRKFKYGDLPIRSTTVKVVDIMGGGAVAQVHEYLRNKFPNYKDNTNANLIVNTINCNRSYWSFNKTARRTDDVTHRHHQYDRLFKRGNIIHTLLPRYCSEQMEHARAASVKRHLSEPMEHLIWRYITLNGFPEEGRTR